MSSKKHSRVQTIEAQKNIFEGVQNFGVQNKIKKLIPLQKIIFSPFSEKGPTKVKYLFQCFTKLSLPKRDILDFRRGLKIAFFNRLNFKIVFFCHLHNLSKLDFILFNTSYIILLGL
jgi:hypothetical protein